jgi:hypothetical protein
MKILSVVAELFHADGQTDRHDKLTLAFRNFVKAPEKKDPGCFCHGEFSRSAKVYQHLPLFACLAPVKRMFMSDLCPKLLHCWEII